MTEAHLLLSFGLLCAHILVLPLQCHFDIRVAVEQDGIELWKGTTTQESNVVLATVHSVVVLALHRLLGLNWD